MTVQSLPFADGKGPSPNLLKEEDFTLSSEKPFTAYYIEVNSCAASAHAERIRQSRMQAEKAIETCEHTKYEFTS